MLFMGWGIQRVSGEKVGQDEFGAWGSSLAAKQVRFARSTIWQFLKTILLAIPSWYSLPKSWGNPSLKNLKFAQAISLNPPDFHLAMLYGHASCKTLAQNPIPGRSWLFSRHEKANQLH